MKFIYSSLLILLLSFITNAQSKNPSSDDAVYNKSKHVIKTTNDVSISQLIMDCGFFSGDTLNGFDFNKSISNALNFSAIYRELKVVVFNDEVEFVKLKYHIVALPCE